MDWSTIIVALLALVGSFVSNYLAHGKTKALVSYRLEQLERKVDLHNNAVERLYKVEKTLDVQDEKIKAANHRIDDLEKEKGEG